MRKIYKSKHDTVLKTLEKYISENNLSVSGDHAGMHIVLTLPGNISSEEVCHLARKEKIHVYSIKEHYLSIPDNAPDSLLIGYSNLSSTQLLKFSEVMDLRSSLQAKRRKRRAKTLPWLFAVY